MSSVLQPQQAEEAVSSLERLADDYNKKLYARKVDHSVFSGEEVPIEKIAAEILSTGKCVCVCV